MFFSLSCIGIAAIIAGSTSQVLGNIQYPVGVVNTDTFGSLNFTEIFAGFGPDKSNARWTRADFNGLTSFAHAPPVRCFGADAETDYDVAVLGAPFDTATSFRPG